LKVTVSIPPVPAGVECTIDGVGVSGTTLALSPGRHVCGYSREDFKPQEKEFDVTAGGAGSIPAPDDEWQKTEGLVNLEAAESAFRAGDWKKANGLLERSDVRSSANISRRQKLKDALDSQGEIESLTDDAELAYRANDYEMFIRKIAEIKSKGGVLSDEQMRNMENAYGEYVKDNERKRENAKNRINSNFNDEKLLMELREVQKIYKGIKRNGVAE